MTGTTTPPEGPFGVRCETKDCYMPYDELPDLESAREAARFHHTLNFTHRPRVGPARTEGPRT